MLDASSATNKEPFLVKATPTGRPYTLLLALSAIKPVRNLQLVLPFFDSPDPHAVARNKTPAIKAIDEVLRIEKIFYFSE